MKSNVVPVLEGWLSLPTAGAMLQVTRQRIFQMGAEEGKLGSLRQIPGAGNRPAAYVVGEAELCRLRRDQLTATIAGLPADEQDRAVVLREQLAAVQVDAARLLQVQLAAAVDAAEVAGEASLAKLLRTKLAGVQVPVAA